MFLEEPGTSFMKAQASPLIVIGTSIRATSTPTLPDAVVKSLVISLPCLSGITTPQFGEQPAPDEDTIESLQIDDMDHTDVTASDKSKAEENIHVHGELTVDAASHNTSMTTVDTLVLENENILGEMETVCPILAEKDNRLGESGALVMVPRYPSKKWVLKAL